MYIKLYYYYTKDTDISYLETTNDLVKNFINKFTNKDIPILYNKLELEKSCQ